MFIYTDGSCPGNGKKNAKGGWAYVIFNNEREILNWSSGQEQDTTNQRMELTAIINACESLPSDTVSLQYICTNEGPITINTDSAYVINCYLQGWWKNWIKSGWKNSKKEPVANKDLWLKLIPFFESQYFHFNKVTGHADDEHNVLVDELAMSAAKS